MASTLQLLLCLLVSGFIRTILTDEGPKKNTEELQAKLDRSVPFPVSDAPLPSKQDSSSLKPEISDSPQISIIDPPSLSDDSSTTTTLASVSEEQGERRYEYRNRNDGHHNRSRSGSYEAHNHSDDGNNNSEASRHVGHLYHGSHPPGSGDVFNHSRRNSYIPGDNSEKHHRIRAGHVTYHGNSSTSNREYPGRYTTGSGKEFHRTRSQSTAANTTRTKRHRPHSSINIRYNDSGSGSYSGSDGNSDSRSRSSSNSASYEKIRDKKRKGKPNRDDSNSGQSGSKAASYDSTD